MAMVTGYPMSGRVEAPVMDVEEPKELDNYGVYYQLGYAWDALSKACGRLAEAAGIAEGFPAEARIVSVLEATEKLQDEINQIRERLMREVMTA